MWLLWFKLFSIFRACSFNLELIIGEWYEYIGESMEMFIHTTETKLIISWGKSDYGTCMYHAVTLFLLLFELRKIHFPCIEKKSLKKHQLWKIICWAFLIAHKLPALSRFFLKVDGEEEKENEKSFFYTLRQISGRCRPFLFFSSSFSRFHHWI